MRLRRRAALLTTLGSLLLGATDAAAYCQTRTCDPLEEDCEIRNGCVVSGLPLVWGSSCLSFSVQRDGSKKHGISATALAGVVEGAFETWRSADCGGGTHPDFSFEDLGLVSCDSVEYNDDWGNANIVMFRDDEWLATDGANALALTTLWFEAKKGTIFDADIEINGTEDDPISISARGGIDLRSVLTHEVGHFLGLSHAGNNTVMRPVYDPGRDDLRTLTPDDVAGICAAFPKNRPVVTSSCEPRNGFSGTCRENSVDDGGCALARPVASSSSIPWVSAALFLTSALVRRRARKQRTSPGRS